MNLYLVQDSDRPLYITAKTMQGALAKWRRKVFDENKEHYEDITDMEEPQGVQLICESNDLLWEGEQNASISNKDV